MLGGLSRKLGRLSGLEYMVWMSRFMPGELGGRDHDCSMVRIQIRILWRRRWRLLGKLVGGSGEESASACFETSPTLRPGT